MARLQFKRLTSLGGSKSQFYKFAVWFRTIHFPGGSKFCQRPVQLKAISQTSCGVLRELGPQIQWLQSYVTDDRIYCVYIAPDQETVRKHAQMGKFPANRISQIRSIIDPTTSE